ncbi:MAG: glycosyltransferase [Candidatus Goldiibacteriota bacterium]
MDKPKVSVLCLAFNQIKFIKQALDGFVSQKTNFDFEVIINDDASTDGTADIIREYQSKYPDIIKPFFQKENQYSKGVRGLAVRFLLPRASGEYIAFCEGDDYFTDENKLQIQADFLDKNRDYSICFHPVRVVYENKESADSVFPEERDPSLFTLKRLIKANFIQTNSVMYRRCEYKNLPVDILPGDWYLHLYHAQYGKIGFIDRVMSVYRRHSGGIWWSAGNNRDDFFRKNGPMHLSMFLETLRIYGHDSGFRNIIMNNILDMAGAVLAVAYKDKWQGGSEAVKLVKNAASDYSAIGRAVISIDGRYSADGTECGSLAVAGAGDNIIKLAAESLKRLVETIWENRFNTGGKLLKEMENGKAIKLELDTDAAQKNGVEISEFCAAVSLAAGGIISGIKIMPDSSEIIKITAGGADVFKTVENIMKAGCVNKNGGQTGLRDLLKTNNCKACIAAESDYTLTLPAYGGHAAVEIPFKINLYMSRMIQKAVKEKLKDLTLISCSYNTPLVVEVMLRSFAAFHGEGPNNLILFENSTNEDTAKFLDENSVPYIRNAGGTHPKSVDEALKICRTKYALVVDSDIVFNRDIIPLFDAFQRNDGVIMGEVCGDRGGYFLHERIHPWFMFVNTEKINRSGISFFDWDRIVKSGSEGFYRNIPLQLNDGKSKYYDVGATFFEDIKKAGFNVLNYKADPAFFTHYEGMSWKKKSGIKGLVKSGIENMEKYALEAEKYSGIKLNRIFINGFESRISGAQKKQETPAGKSLSISVVVPVLKGTDTARQAVEKLALEMGKGDEVIVIAADNEGVLKMTREIRPKTGLKILCASKNANLAAMYNTGIDKAAGEIIIFTREDIICGGGFFERHRMGHSRHPGVNTALIGNIIPGSNNTGKTMNLYLNGGGIEQVDFGAIGPHEGIVGPGYFNSSNVSVKREFLDKHPVFDVFFGDTVTPAAELGRRLFDRGMELFYDPEIKVEWEHGLKPEEFAWIKYYEGRHYPYYLDKLHHVRNWADLQQPLYGDLIDRKELMNEKAAAAEKLIKSGNREKTGEYISSMLALVFLRGAKDAVAENLNGETVLFESGKWGTYKKGKNNAYVSLTSEYDPEREVKLILSAIPPGRDVVFIGAGMGRHIEEYQKTRGEVKTALYEPHDALFNYLSKKINMEGITRITGHSSLEDLKNRGYFPVILPSLKSTQGAYAGAYKIFQAEAAPVPG